MNIQDFQQILKNMRDKHGSYIKMGWASDVSTEKAKRCGITIYKCVSTTVRLGINYSHTAYAMRAAASQGDSAPRKPWYHHTAYKYVVEHNETGKQYVQAYCSPNKPKVTYVIDGKPCSYDTLRELGWVKKQNQASELCLMTIPIENIDELGRYISIKEVR